MQVWHEAVQSYPEDPTRFFEFDRRAGEAGDFLLIEGHIDYRLLEKWRGRKIVKLEFEEPNRFLVPDPLFNQIPFEHFYYKVFTICPYSADWLNYQYGNNKRTAVCFPFNSKYTPPQQPKLYDIIYAGHLVHPSILRLVNEMRAFNYRFISQSSHPMVTDHNVSYVRKLELIAQSRITIVHNVLFMEDQHIANALTIPGMRFNHAMAGLGAPRGPDNECYAPQLKSRLFDAAFCRSLILVRRDPWNLVERFFEPDREFVYYEAGRLKDTVSAILARYDDYLPVIERAHQRAVQNYTTDAFFDKYLRPLV